ncbi:PriCT-2 domain-containing protein [Falsiroseomonas sp. E2-1-a4]|uniref:PriCT-2 domain-containing protein n=1 Tax=Falsiroseomonas sp. E2-1-a4 TaxID=3239299 RepID=UPI003F3B0568
MSGTPFPAALARLRDLNGWLLWRWVEVKGKLTKPPFQSRFPERNASNRNPKHWSDFRTARDARRAGKADGIGFVVSVCQEIVWGDLDDCRNPETGSISDWAMRIVRMANTYTEITPSGRGLRIVGLLTGEGAGTAIHTAFKLAGGGKGEIFYRADRYVTISGRRLKDTPDELRPIDETISMIQGESLTSRDRLESSSRDLIPASPDDLYDPVLTMIDKRPLALSEEQVRDYLAKLPPHNAEIAPGVPWWSYPRWMDVVFAVHDQTGGSEDGYALVDEWCATTPHYDSDGLRAKWESARGSDKGDAVTFRSVIKWANDWTRPEREAEFDRIMSLMVQAQNRVELEDAKLCAQLLQIDSTTMRVLLTAQYRTAFRRITGSNLSEAAAKKELAFRNPEMTNMPDWLKSFCWVSGTGKFYNAHNGMLYTPQTFDITFGDRFLTEEEIAQGIDTPMLMTPHKAAVSRYKIPEVSALGYMPYVEGDTSADDALSQEGGGGSRRPRIYVLNGTRYVNRYHTRGAVDAVYVPWSDETRAEIKLIVSLFRRVCGSKRDTAIMLSFLRHVLLYRTRVRFCPVLSSAEGSGKTTAMVKIPCLLFGAENVGIYPPQVLLDKSDGSWMDGDLWKVIEEVWVPEGARLAVIERMKTVITNDSVSPRFMYEGTRTVPNTASYVGLTNHDDVLALTSKDTRFYPIQGERVATARAMAALLASDPTYYHRLNAAIRRSIGAFRGWLETEFVPHPDFSATNGRAPASDIKQRVIEEARDPLDRDILHLLEQETHPLLTRGVVCLVTLHRTLVERGVSILMGGERKRVPEVLSAALKRLDLRARGQFRVGYIGRDDIDTPSDAPTDNRTRIYTSGDGPFDQGEITAARLNAWVDNDGL